jgi:hypothetical protein
VHLRLFHDDDETLLRSLPLKFISPDIEKTSKEFWSEFEAQRQAAEQFAQEAAMLPAEEQVTAVEARLRELNELGLGPLGRTVEENAVTAAALVLTDKTRDVTPLRAFTNLKKLTLAGGPIWLDISAVNSLPLEELTCREEIIFRNAPVLRGIPTLKTINDQPIEEALAPPNARR